MWMLLFVLASLHTRDCSFGFPATDEQKSERISSSSQTFYNKRHEVALSATLTRPVERSIDGAVIFVSGGGRIDRNNQFYPLLAEDLARRGVLSLRYDKRGVGESSGNYDNSTIMDFASDLDCAIEFLRSLPRAGASRIGLIGHSEGASIVSLVASRRVDVSFVVLLAPPAQKYEDAVYHFMVAEAGLRGTSADEMVRQITNKHKINELVKSKKTDDQTVKAIKAALQDSGFDDIEAEFKRTTSPQARFRLTFDPLNSLRKLTAPALIVFGEKDIIVDPRINTPLVKECLSKAGSSEFTIVEIRHVNHSFCKCKTGSWDEYLTATELSTDFRSLTTDWVVERFLRRR